jgi:hypothetical protein
MSEVPKPAWSSLCLMTDYGAGTPLWIGGENLSDLEPLNLGPHLVRSLLSWQHHFDEHFLYDREPSWDRPASRDWYAQEGARLHERLRRALPDIQVTLDLWPVTGKAPSC